MDKVKNPLAYIRQLYDWTLKWAEHPKSVFFLGIFSTIEGIFFPIPVDPFLLAMGASKPKKAIHFALIASFSSVIGGLIGYSLGFWFWEATSPLFFKYIAGPESFQVVVNQFQDNAFMAIFLAGFTPIPYKVFAIAGGVAKISLYDFILGSLLGRSLRFLVFGISLFFWGPSIREYIEKHFNKLTVVLGLLVLIGFAVLKMN